MKFYTSIRTLAVFSLVILMTLGCAPNTTKELQAEVKPLVITVNRDYEEVYENLVFQLEGCHTGSVAALHMFVQHRLNRNKQYGEAVLRSINMGDVSIWLQAKVYHQGSSLTKVEIWEPSWGKRRYVVKKWIVDDYQECS